MTTRSYLYDQDDLQHLFAKIIESLSAPDLPDDIIQSILVGVCDHFRFGCGFVYEADHTHEFHIKEQHAVYKPYALPDSFHLEDHLSSEQLDDLRQYTLFYNHGDTDGPHLKSPRLFGSNTYMLVPVISSDKEIIGLVGMMDRRHNILLGERAIQACKMVLNLLANNIKLRIYQRNLEYAQQTLVDILDNTGVDIYVNDFKTHEILYLNKSMAAPYGGREKMLGRKCYEALYTDKTGQCDYCPQKMLIDDEGNPTKVYSWDYRRPFDGSWFRVLSATFRWFDGRLAHVVSSVDITENKVNEATIARMANYDALTNLPNRRKLIADCQETMEQAKVENSSGYLLFFDLDNFKKLNDSVGHQAGDELLVQIGRMIQDNALTQGHCYRYGGDEFVLLYPRVDRAYIRTVVEYLLNRFNQPWQLAATAPVCRASIGIASYPDDATDPDDLFATADAMMYKAKENGRGCACFVDGEIINTAK